MTHADALTIAQDLVEQLRPWCERIEIAGSLRRRKPEVGDIDLVLQLKPYARLPLLQQLHRCAGRAPERWGPKAACLERYRGIQVDLYFAEPDTWATLLLIRTGSKNHNILLCRRAQALGLKLHANGEGLVRNGTRLPIDTEADVFMLLGLPYREPWERE